MKKNYYLVFLVLLTFFVISFLSNIIGPLVPEIIEDFRLSLTTVALLPFAFFIAYGVMSVPSGILVERYGGKPAGRYNRFEIWHVLFVYHFWLCSQHRIMGKTFGKK